MKGPLHTRRGFTLIEMLISMVVLLLVMDMALTLFLPSLNRFSVADSAYDAQRHVAAGLRMMATDLKDTRADLLVSGNGQPSLPAFFIPTPRDGTGAFHLTPESLVDTSDLPDWQGWIVYWTVPEPAPNQTQERLCRAFVAGNPLISPLPSSLPPAFRVVASGLVSVRVEVGLHADLVHPNPGGISLFLDRSTAVWTPGGRVRIRLVVGAARILHDLATTFEGEKLLDVPY